MMENTGVANSKKSILRHFNKDVKQTFFVNVSRLVTGPLIMLIIPFFVTKQMQGYWYSFISISALSVLADLGFTQIVLQFSAHEFAHLSLNKDGHFEGSTYYFDRLASFFRFISRWAVLTSSIAFPVIFISGYIILNGEKTDFVWVLPWILYLVGAGIKFYLNVIISFFEGCGLISTVQKMRNVNLLTYFFVSAICLFAGMHLYAIGLASVISSLIFLIQAWGRLKKPVMHLIKAKIEVYSWRKEVLSLMWRYTISWVSGYLIFQLFTPIAFKFYGSVYAGQVGITITLMNAIFSLSNVWIYVVNPKMNMLVSQKNWEELDRVFVKSLKNSVITYAIFSGGCILFFYVLMQYFPQFYSRFLGLQNIIWLSVAWFVQLIINSLATYSRANKSEPYVLPSSVKGIYVAITTFIIGFWLPQSYLLVGFYTSFLFSFPWFYNIYRRQKMLMRAG